MKTVIIIVFFLSNLSRIEVYVYCFIFTDAYSKVLKYSDLFIILGSDTRIFHV